MGGEGRGWSWAGNYARSWACTLRGSLRSPAVGFAAMGSSIGWIDVGARVGESPSALPCTTRSGDSARGQARGRRCRDSAGVWSC